MDKSKFVLRPELIEKGKRDRAESPPVSLHQIAQRLEPFFLLRPSAFVSLQHQPGIIAHDRRPGCFIAVVQEVHKVTVAHEPVALIKQGQQIVYGVELPAREVADVVEAIDQEDSVELVILSDRAAQEPQFGAGIESDISQYVDLPLRMRAAQDVREALIDILDSMAGSERITKESNAPFARGGREGILDIVAATRGINMPVSVHPALANFGVGQRIGSITKKSAINLSCQQDGRHQAHKN